MTPLSRQIKAGITDPGYSIISWITDRGYSIISWITDPGYSFIDPGVRSTQ